MHCQIAAARLYISAAGLFEAFWNGQKIGDEFLTPYCTNYNAWVEAITFDITEEVCKSAAAGEAGTLSVMLGNGWFNGRFGFNQDRKPHFEGGKRLTAEVHITYTDGTEAVIGTDESWDVTLSNITFSNIYDGEQRDDTLPEVPAVKAVIAAPPKGKLMDRLSLPVRVKHVLTPVALISTPAGETVLDLGQNQAGIWRLALDVPAGTKVHLQVGEVLQNGNFYNDNLRTAKAEYIYVSNGKKITLEPQEGGFRGAFALLGHGPDRNDGDRGCEGEPSHPERGVGKAEQFHRCADGLPAARRAHGLDRRRGSFLADRAVPE